MEFKHINLHERKIGNDNKLCLIAGPCVITSLEETLEIALECKKIAELYNVQFIFKASYDKANRTSINSYRGPGLNKGLEVLAHIKKNLDVPILTDVHETSHVEKVAGVADIIQIPAFLSRQTDLVLEAAKTNKIVNIKKAQFMEAGDLKFVIDKIVSTGNERIMLTERGSSFGYHNLVVDMRGIEKMRSFGYPVIFDATHSIQLPSLAKGASGGEREYIIPLAKASTALGIAGLFVEVFPNPLDSPSDAGSVLAIDDLPKLLQQVLSIDKAVKKGGGYEVS